MNLTSSLANKADNEMDVGKKSSADHKEELKKLCGRMISHQIDIAGLTQEKIADILNVTRGNIGHYVSGRRLPSLEIFLHFIKVFGLEDKSLSEILHLDEMSIKASQQVMTRCPILEWDDAACWRHDKNKILQNKDIARLSSSVLINNDCYALKIRDDLMISHAEGIVFKEGAYIIVDPKKKYENRSFVVAKKGDEIIFRQYRKDSGYQYLILLKDAHPRRTIDFNDEIEILGVVVAYLDVLI